MNTTPSPQPTLLLNLNEVATQLRWTRRSVERQIAQRRLRAVHLGRSVRVERTELDRFVASMRMPMRVARCAVGHAPPPADSATSRYRGADGRWHARVTVGRRLDGQRDRRHLSRTTKRELDAAVRDLENARDSGQQPWLLDNVTVEDWLEHWLEEILPLSVRWKTRSGYASHLRVHVIPTIGPRG